MKNLLLFSFAFTALFTSACVSEASFIGSDVIATDSRAVTGSDRISLNGIVDVNIIQGTDFSVTVRANDNIINEVETELRGSTLDIGLNSGNFRNITAAVEVVLPTLAGISLTSTGDATVSNFSGLTSFAVDISSTGTAIFSNSTTDQLTANLSGTGGLEAFGLTAAAAEVNTSSTGSAEVTVSNALTGSISGTGDISFRGSPTVEVTVSGTGEVIDAN
jgi:hypothetical protein